MGVILVTGGQGALASRLPLEAVRLGHDLLDVADEEAVRRVIRSYRPATVIHCAAVTDHQPDPWEAIAVNVLGTLHVAEVCESIGATLVYLSSHAVEVGQGGLYAATKRAGEAIVRRTCSDWLIVRGSWYTPEKLAEWAAGAVTDAWCSREPIQQAADKIAALIRDGQRGVVTIGGPRRTFYEIASAEYDGPVTPIARRDLSLPYELPEDASV